MKHQQVKVDYWEMVKTSSTYLCLVLSGWILFKLVHAVFLFPGYLKRNQVEYEKVYAKMEEKCKIVGDEKDVDETENVEEPKKDK